MVSRSPAPRPPRLPPVLSAAESCPLADRLEWVGVETAGDFSGQSASDCEINASRVVGARFIGTALDGIRMRDTLIESCDLSGARLGDADFTRVEFRNCKMPAIDLAGARLHDVLFRDSKLDNANFRMISGDHVRFEHASLRAGDFYAAQVAQAQFLDCDLTASEFSKSELAGVRLQGSNVEGLKGAMQLRTAVIDSTQVLPLALGLLAALNFEINDDREDD
jgi:uncharacterized protein YjbI with pentapeptide repeats